MALQFFQLKRDSVGFRQPLGEVQPRESVLCRERPTRGTAAAIGSPWPTLGNCAVALEQRLGSSTTRPSTEVGLQPQNAAEIPGGLLKHRLLGFTRHLGTPDVPNVHL